MLSQYNNLVLSNVSFSGNKARSGGGMYSLVSTAKLSNLSFSANVVDESGGGFYQSDGSSDIANVSFTGNQAGENGGGLYNMMVISSTITNVAFSGNLADSGGGMFNNFSTTLTFTNLSFAGNRANFKGGGIYNTVNSPTIQNSVFWNNRQGSEPGTAGDSISNNDSSTPVIRYSLLQGCNPGGAWNSTCGTDGGNNLPDADPRFVTLPDPIVAPSTAGDLRLQAGSPAADAGDNNADLDADGAGAVTIADVVSDLAGSARIFNVTVDLGAYESQSSQPVNHDTFLPMLSR